MNYVDRQFMQYIIEIKFGQNWKHFGILFKVDFDAKFELVCCSVVSNIVSWRKPFTHAILVFCLMNLNVEMASN